LLYITCKEILHLVEAFAIKGLLFKVHLLHHVAWLAQLTIIVILKVTFLHALQVFAEEAVVTVLPLEPLISWDFRSRVIELLVKPGVQVTWLRAVLGDLASKSALGSFFNCIVLRFIIRCVLKELPIFICLLHFLHLSGLQGAQSSVLNHYRLELISTLRIEHATLRNLKVIWREPIWLKGALLMGRFSKV